MKKVLFLLVGLCFLSAPVFAAVHEEVVEYQHGEVLLEGFLAYDEAIQGPRPGILVVHEWTGLGDYAKRRARELATLGYTAFAIDMYGKGIRPDNPKDASAEASKYKNDRKLMRERARVGFEVLKNNSMIDATRLAAIGYCFGGTTVLELARSGADLRGVVSFHGSLDTPNLEDAKNIKGKVLALHGADDPYVPVKDVEVFQKEMKDARVDWSMVFYGGAVHSFTNPDAGNDNSKGAAYNELADRRSWEAMRLFLKEATQ